MAHDKVYGFCESKCKVEVPSKAEFDEFKNSISEETLINTINEKVIEVAKPIKIIKVTSGETYSVSELLNYRTIFFNNTIASFTIYITNDTDKVIAIKKQLSSSSSFVELNYVPAGAQGGDKTGEITVSIHSPIEVELFDIS